MVYVDDWIVGYDKPSGQLVHRGWAQDREVAMTVVRDHLKARVNPVHRIDRGTSGVVLFARDTDTTRALAGAFAMGGVRKDYLALVRGRFEGQVELDHPVPRSEGGERVPAKTLFRGLGVSDVARCSLVHARPESGRLHQIRRHLKHLSHPIVGDVRYGKGPINREYREKWGLHRLALHAVAVTFTHPVTDEEVCVQAPVSGELADTLERLGLRWDGWR